MPDWLQSTPRHGRKFNVEDRSRFGEVPRMAINTVARKSSRTTRTTREVRRERSAGRQEHISFEELAGCYIGEYADFGDFLYAEPITILKVPRPSAQIASAGVIEKEIGRASCRERV